MEVLQAITLHQLSEQERRTNILIQELGRPTVDPNIIYDVRTSTVLLCYFKVWVHTLCTESTTNLTHTSNLHGERVYIAYIVII